MNKDRRKRLRTIICQLADLKGQLEHLQEAEEEAMENMPESLQDSERYERMEEAAEALQTAVYSLEEIADSLGELIAPPEKTGGAQGGENG